MELYWAIIDKNGYAQLSNLPEAQTRADAVGLSERHPHFAPFRAVCFVDAEAVSHVLSRLADRVPEDAPAARMLRATALAFSADADDDAAWERVVFG